MAATQIEAYARERFSAPISGKEKAFDVYRRGKGPPILVMQELPGISQPVLRFCDWLADAGFEVWLPHWFGPIGKMSGLNVARALCMRREFQLFSQNKSSAVVEWMRALAAHVARVTGHEKVGAIGMCLSGNFAMALIAHPNVWAAVASQPSLPPKQEALHLSADEIAASRAALDAKGAMRAYRFGEDKLCTGARFDAIGAAFNDDRVRVVLNVIEGPGHSVFGAHYREEAGSPTAAALAEVLDYFAAQLR